MKKVFTIISVSILIWGCAKKVTPVNSGTPSSNTGSVSSSNTGSVNTPENSKTSTISTPPSNTASTPMPTTATTTTKTAAEKTNTSDDMALRAGQQTYSAKCGRCHGLKVTTDFTELRWVQVMQVMAPRANLTETEKENVLAYVRANAKKG